MKKIKTLGLLGTGVIGAGWAARAMHAGIDIIAMDTNPKMENVIQNIIENALPHLSSLTEGINMPQRGKFRFTSDLEDVASNSDFIQENVPENLDIKKAVLSKVSKNSNSDIIIASSTSGFMPSEMQVSVSEPHRFLVGHPFNPVYLCPLVEIVGGRLTSLDTKKTAKEFYESLGMHALMVRKEVPGHISDRLQEAMWREILHALNDDIATTKELDESIAYGPGLRWAIMGMNQIYMMAGGSGGARHFIKQFGPALEWPWTHLKAPPLTEDIINRFVEGTEEQAGGKSIKELAHIRDECLTAIQKILAKHNIGAGTALNKLKERNNRE